MIRKKISLEQSKADIDSVPFFFSTARIAESTQAECRSEHAPELLPHLSRQPACETIRIGLSVEFGRADPSHPTDKKVVAINERERISIRAQKRWKEIPSKKTHLAGGNNTTINGDSERSALVMNRVLAPYLALNWQRTNIEGHFTSRDRRFPRPGQQPCHERSATSYRPVLFG
jgi:hypothetical protein